MLTGSSRQGGIYIKVCLLTRKLSQSKLNRNLLFLSIKLMFKREFLWFTKYKVGSSKLDYKLTL